MDILIYIQLLIQNGKMSYFCVKWRIQYFIWWGGAAFQGFGGYGIPVKSKI